MKVFITKQIPETGITLLKDAGLDIFFPSEPNLSREAFIRHSQKADVILNVGKNSYDSDFFEQCPNVKAIALFSVGFDHVAIPEATKRTIPIGNTPDVLSNATADTAFLLMQSVARRASFHFERVKNGDWNTDFNPLANLGQELQGKTLGIYGLGRIGFEMAKKCKAAFDMRIIYHNRSQNTEAEKSLGATYVSFDDLVTQADVLSIHASYSDSQHEIFNKQVFDKMKPDSIFINTARGGFHHQQELYEALIQKKIRGAGLDVTNPEPIDVNDPILQLSTVCVLPHIGSATVEARNGMARLAAENIIAFSKGEKMPYIANPEVYEH